jgi:hypothetical protein
MLSGLLESGRPSSTMYAALQSDMRALMVEAAELRRLGIAVTSDAKPVPDNVIDWRARATTHGTRNERPGLGPSDHRGGVGAGA